MLHLKWEILRNRNILSGISKIRDCDRIEPASAYRAGRVTESIASQQQKANDQNMRLLKEYAKKDQFGNLVPIPNNPDGGFEFPEGNKQKFEIELKKLSDTEFVVSAKKIEFVTIEACKLTPAEITALVDAGILTEPIS